MTDKFLEEYEKSLLAAVIPDYFLIEQFCNSGAINIDYTIPPVVTANPKAASLESGAPQLQQVKPILGGSAFPRQEYNGILRLLSNIIAYLNKGNLFTFDIKNIAGYAAGTVLYDHATGKFVQSLEDGNTNNFITDPTLIDGTHWRFISVNPNTSNDFTVSPVVPTRPTGEQSEFIANMQALWNQTRGIGIGLNSQTGQTFNSVSDLTTQTVNGGCYLASGLAMPTPSDAYYMTRIASREVSNNSAFMATLLSDSSFTYIGQFYDGIFGWIRLATVEQFQNGTFAAILLSLAANSATLGTAGVATGSLAIYGNQPTNPVNFVFAGNGSAGAGAYINANYDNANQVAFINFPYKLSDGITLARPCLGNSNAASDQIAKLADITANGGGIVASGTTSSVTWVKFANGLLLQYSNNTVVTGAVINFPVSFTAIPQVVSSSIDLNAGAQSAWVQLKSIGPTGFFATAYTATNLPTTNTIGLSWLAIGYSNA